MSNPTLSGGLTPDQLAAQVAAAQAAAPSGVTTVDAAQLLAAIQDLQAQVDALNAEKAASGRAPLISLTEWLAECVTHYAADTPGAQLAQDLKEAAANAVESGSLAQVEKLIPKLSKWLHRNSPPPGENYHYNNAVQVADFHLPDAIESFTPAPRRPGLAGAAPVPVVSGSVVG